MFLDYKNKHKADALLREIDFFEFLQICEHMCMLTLLKDNIYDMGKGNCTIVWNGFEFNCDLFDTISWE